MDTLSVASAVASVRPMVRSRMATCAACWWRIRLTSLEKSLEAALPQLDREAQEHQLREQLAVGQSSAAYLVVGRT